ncbi:uncharacterized protein LOC111363047, partial [Spodoptera litura]|uniref:Uncharacterized protein LOC111363047 n=1 Tax=Spodoptera litura TaxID=69820 RepID=A0A9J7EQ52_SPOLT
VEAAKVPDVRSAGVVTSDGRPCSLPGHESSCIDRGTHGNNLCTLYRVTKNDEKALTHPSFLNVADDAKEGLDEYLRSHLVTSCRYYSGLLTKQFDRVKNNLTRHLAQPVEEPVQTPCLPVYKVEACTMKPSGRAALASQTIKHPYCKPTRHMSCCILSPAISLTDICKNDKTNLKSVYYMLSAIEGRLRRLKLSTHNVY